MGNTSWFFAEVLMSSVIGFIVGTIFEYVFWKRKMNWSNNNMIVTFFIIFLTMIIYDLLFKNNVDWAGSLGLAIGLTLGGLSFDRRLKKA